MQLEGTTVAYDLTPNAWQGYHSFLENLASLPRVKRICEVGGGATRLYL